MTGYHKENGSFLTTAWCIFLNVYMFPSAFICRFNDENTLSETVQSEQSFFL